jgi:hypothetical protein
MSNGGKTGREEAAPVEDLQRRVPEGTKGTAKEAVQPGGLGFEGLGAARSPIESEPAMRPLASNIPFNL